MKKCNKCGQDKQLADFSPNPLTKDGYQTQCKSCLSAYARQKRQERADIEMVTENSKLAKQKQRAQDKNRIETKSWRNHARYQNAVAPYTKKLIEFFNDYKLHDLPPAIPVNLKAQGVLHLSDIHFNELVEMVHNKYDYEIAGQRLRMYAQKAIKHFKAEGVTNVFIALTADLMNSDRRLDELLAMGTNRARATGLAVDILHQLIIEVAQEFNVTVGWVCGNEGRVGRELGYQAEIASDNYDETIMRVLQLMFRGSDRVTFVSPVNPLELVVQVAGHNILLVHGHCLGKNYEKSIAQLKAKYAAKGIIIRYVIFGHIHEAYISDTFARSGSPVGDNTYSDHALNLAGRASQNYYIIYENGAIDGVKVDLQICDGVVGYKTDHEFWAFNIKSAKKCHKEEVIVKVVV